MHLEQVTHAVKAPRPFDWDDLTQSLDRANKEAAARGVESPVWEMMKPECEWWFRCKVILAEIARRPENREIAVIGYGWTEKE